VTIDVPARVAYRANEPLPLSRMAFDLLVALVRHRGAVITRAELMREVWGYSEGVVSRTLDTHIFELRRLIESDPAKPTRIRTVWRIGYRFD
jgi:DNA-binding response OmpR family regulator